jgi:hypothetical protein
MKIPSTKKNNSLAQIGLTPMVFIDSSLEMMIYTNQVAPRRAQINTKDQNLKEKKM